MELIKLYSVKATVDQFLSFYNPESPRWDDISAVSKKLQWATMTHQTASEYLAANGVGQLFKQELVEAATRVNYGQVCCAFLNSLPDSG